MEEKRYEGLTILGGDARSARKNLETFPCPKNVRLVEFETEELTSLCPLTKQPDYYNLKIEYVPGEKCIESKALKLYLWTFRETGQFCEELSRIILQDIIEACHPVAARVTLKMNPRGGITIKAIAQEGIFPSDEIR